MTKQEFIAKYEGWFSYTRREELKKQMESDLDAVFQALRQPPVIGSVCDFRKGEGSMRDGEFRDCDACKGSGKQTDL